jgi:excisionase family DNA binding protein
MSYDVTMAAATIDLRTAAEQLGVHYQTAYGWVRSGRLPAVLVGRSYRIEPSAVERFEQRRRRPRRPQARRPRGGFGLRAAAMYDQLVDGDEASARGAVSDLTGSGVEVTDVIQFVLAPALDRIGEEWQAGRLGVSTEHRASAIVERILGEHHPTPRGRRRGVAVVGAVSGDRHSLPTSMAAAALREDNWHVHHLGSDVPHADLSEFAMDHQVDLVVVTITLAAARPAADALARQLRGSGIPCLIGSPGDTLEQLRRQARASR